jgi:acyl-coenzyme A synthetase/AMP-(fatty) acid ligase
MPGYEVKAVNDSGQLARPGELGQLYARGPVGTLYWGPPEDSERVRCDQKATVHDGWVRIGDWVTIDDEGYVTFVARAEDLITKDGLRFGPGRVEDALLEHPSVAEAGVIGVPDASGAQQVKAYVVLRDGWTGSAELEQAILGRCRHDLVEAELPSELAFVDTLPRTSYGTLVRRLLWEQWMADSKARLAAPA